MIKFSIPETAGWLWKSSKCYHGISELTHMQLLMLW